MGIAEDLIIIIVLGLAGGLVSHRLRIPPIIGYILAGIAIGPYTGLVPVSNIHDIELLAEIGVALLLFSIGLDLSFQELKSVKGIALVGTPIQLLLLAAAGFGMGQLVGLNTNQSLVLGMVISLSSTMVVLKTLMSRGLMGTLSSKVMIGILIVQDLAAIPMMLIIPNLNSAGDGLLPMAFTLLKALGILVVIIVVGMRIVPVILKRVVRLNSRELFLITITALGLGVGYLTHLFGLSLAFGAFVAGMVVSESDYSHQALNDIIPLRDIFGLVFFTSIGMLLDPGFILNNLKLVLLMVVLVLVAKFTVFFTLSLVFKYYNIIPLALGFGLAQIGEFSFVLARAGLKGGVVSQDFYSLVLSVSVVTMITSPFLSMLTVPLYGLKKKFFKHEEIQTINITGDQLNGHVVIAGGGRVGFQVAAIFTSLNIPFVIIEQDFRNFEKVKKAGMPVIFGDASQETVLHGAKIERAKLLIVTIPFIATTHELVSCTARCNHDVRIIARADNFAAVTELYRLNIYEVVQPEFEASIEIIRQSLMALGYPLGTIQEFTDDMRRRSSSNPRLDSLEHTVLTELKNAPFMLEMSWYEVHQGSMVEDKSIGDLAIRKRLGISVVGVLRRGRLLPNPEPSFIFEAHDFVAVIGLPENREQFRKECDASERT